MSQIEKLMFSVLCGQRDANIKFKDLQNILYYLGFKERIRGDHYIYTKGRVDEIINIQPKGVLAKPYQVKQVRNLILKYKLGVDDDE